MTPPMETKKSGSKKAESGRTGSGLSTPIGLVILAALILLAAFLNLPAMEVFMATVFILCLLAFLWGRLALRHIEVKTDGTDCFAFPGENTSLRAELVNRKILPLVWLDVDFVTQPDQCVEPVDPDPSEKISDIGARFTWVMPYQRLRWKQEAHAVRRGIYTVDSVRLSSGDGFGLSSLRSSVDLSSPFRYIVFPSVIPIDETIILSNMREMEKNSQGFYTDRTLIQNVRPYTTGDPVRSINWRILARSDELTINVHEKLDMCRVCLVLDPESFTHMERKNLDTGVTDVVVVDTDRLEEMISALASLIIRLSEQEVICSLVLPGSSQEKGKVIIPEDKETQVPFLLTVLSEINYSGESTQFPWDLMDASRHLLGQMYLFSDSSASAVRDELSGFGDYGTIRIVGSGPSSLPDRMYRKEDIGIR